MSLNAYQAYGLSIHTDLVCPELPPYPHPIHQPDVTITLLPPESDTLCPLLDGSYEVQTGCFRLDVPGVARYRSKKGSASGFSRWPVRPPRRFAFSSSVSSMSALLYQRGLLPLHGSAVVTQWGAMMFVGPQGSGKSTLAAEFHRCGYRLLSDDVCAVESRPEGLRILPALTQFRLCATAYQYLGAPPEARFDVDKFAVPMGEKYCPHPAPLRAIHILSDDTGESPRFEVVRGLDRVRCLFENLYRPHFLKGQRTQKDLVGLVGVIAQRTTVAVVSRKRDITAITDLVRFLESTWDERFGTSSNPREEFNAPLRS